ncbi:hypothetical protein [Actinoplanes philippinensis]|uniref:hypothetical protein n=1 Tax=Actinoplanes philippinensis TaxID=35752 RepID=UPI0033E4E12D
MWTGPWRQSYELVGTHISQVNQYRETLRQPGRRSPVQDLDMLIANLEVTAAMQGGRSELELIHRAYAANDALLTHPGRDSECGYGMVDIAKARTAGGPTGTPDDPERPTFFLGPGARSGRYSTATAAPERVESSFATLAGIGSALTVAGVAAAAMIRLRRCPARRYAPRRHPQGAVAVPRVR